MPTVVFWVLLVLALSTALGVLVGQHLRRVRLETTVLFWAAGKAPRDDRR